MMILKKILSALLPNPDVSSEDDDNDELLNFNNKNLISSHQAEIEYRTEGGKRYISDVFFEWTLDDE